MSPHKKVINEIGVTRPSQSYKVPRKDLSGFSEKSKNRPNQFKIIQ